MKKICAMLLVLLTVVILAACGGAPQAAEFTLEMSEFAYSPESIEVSVGQQVTIHLKNTGALEHEVMFGREVVTNDAGVAINFEHNLFEHEEPDVIMADGDSGHEGEDEHEKEGAESEHADDHDGSEDQHMDAHGENEHGMEGHGFMVSIPGNQPDHLMSLVFTVTEDMVGEWEIGCFLDGGSHFASGMSGTFTVTP